MTTTELLKYYEPEVNLLHALQGDDESLAYLADLIGFTGRSARILDHENVSFLSALHEEHKIALEGYFDAPHPIPTFGPKQHE